MQAALLKGRGIVSVSGPEARAFLQGLVTVDAMALGDNETVWAALLTPQGKILFDFMMTAANDGVLLDCPRAQTPDLVKRLGFYKLRAKVVIEDVSDRFVVIALFDGPIGEGLIDRRDARIGARIVAPIDDAPGLLLTFGGDNGLEAYEAHRIATGVPAGGLDFVYGDAFPHEVNMNLMNGVSFTKGCYVGQEVVARMQHRATMRKRVVRVVFAGDAPEPGTPVYADDLLVGHMGSSAAGKGLAMLRLDRAEDAGARGQAMTAATTRIDLAPPD